MSFNKNDDEKAKKLLEQNGWEKQKNGDGYQRGNQEIHKSGGSWQDNNGNRHTNWSDMSRSKKV
jgi:ABC-type transport system substrate-binding protein